MNSSRFLHSQAIKDRRRMTHHGTAVATIVVDAKGILIEDPIITINGVYDTEDEDEIEQEVMDAVVAAIDEIRPDKRRDDNLVGEMSRRAVRRCIQALCGKKPHTEIHLVRI